MEGWASCPCPQPSPFREGGASGALPGGWESGSSSRRQTPELRSDGVQAEKGRPSACVEMLPLPLTGAGTGLSVVAPVVEFSSWGMKNDPLPCGTWHTADGQVLVPFWLKLLLPPPRLLLAGSFWRLSLLFGF